MQKVGIFYGSDSSNTQGICQKVAKELGGVSLPRPPTD